jgi:hypothetical protein
MTVLTVSVTVAVSLVAVPPVAVSPSPLAMQK